MPARGPAVGIALLVAALLINAGLALYNIRDVATTVQWVSHTNAVLFNLEAVLSSLTDAEAAERGYLLTGQAGYLEPYHRAMARLPSGLAELRELVMDNPAQTARALRMEQLASERLAIVRRSIERFDGAADRARAAQSARQSVLTGEGKQVMDAIRDEIGRMQAVEQELMEERAARARIAGRTALASTLIALALALTLVAVVLWLFARNLTTRQRAAEVVYAERERLRTTLSSIGDGVMVTDPRGRVTMMNPVAESLTRWGLDAIGQPIEEVFRLVNEDTRHVVESPVAKVLREGTVVAPANHTVLIGRDGTEVPIDDSGAPIRDARGRLSGVVLVFRDTAGRRAAERAAETEARRKDEFLAMLAHELRNPLAPIRTAAHTLGLVGAPDERVRWVSGVIERQVGLMTRLVDDLLDVSRITLGKIELKRGPVAVARVIAQAVEMARPAVEARRQSLAVDVADDAGAVDGDPARLAQAVGNLLDNAIKYTEEDGRIRLEVRAAGDEVMIAVHDSGIGIAPDLLPHVFDLFTQADRSLERRQGGLGIGLTLVRRLVEMHGGRVEAASEGQGRGSEFTIHLPRLGPAAAAADSRNDGATPAPPPGPPRRVLVVDDQSDSTDSLAMLLRLRGHEVWTACDGPSALGEFARVRPDVVFLDLGLPGMSGYDVARQLRTLPEGHDVRLVAVTGYGTEADREKSRAAGFDVHLTKPVDPGAVETLVARAG